MHHRDAYVVVLAEGAQVGVEGLHRAGLDDEVQLFAERGGEVLDDGDGVGHAALGGGAFEDAGEAHEDAKVGGEAVADPGSLDLHDDVGAVEELGGVDLGDGR